MNYSGEALYRLLPAIHRTRDAERGYPLRQLIEVIAAQARVLEENLDQLYDNAFVETAEPWALSYLADLLGLTGVSSAGAHLRNPRAEVGHTLAVRRRKGTATVLELVAHDVTGWPARVVEYFARLATTQHLHHVRPQHAAFASLASAADLALFGTPFERANRTIEVRRIRFGRGRWNIGNVGVHLWRLRAFRCTQSPLVPVDHGSPDPAAGRRFRFHPLGIDAPLFNQPWSEEAIEHLAEPVNVPLVLTRRLLLGEPVQSPPDAPAPRCFHPSTDFYGPARGFMLLQPAASGAVPLAYPATDIVIADLGDTPTGWGHETLSLVEGTNPLILLDPERGRTIIPLAKLSGAPTATFSHAFSAPLGGGEYNREASFTTITPAVAEAWPQCSSSPTATLGQALTEVVARAAGHPDAPTARIEISDNDRHALAGPLELSGCQLELRAADGFRPLLALEPAPPAPSPAALVLTGQTNASFALNGFLVAGCPLQLGEEEAPSDRRISRVSLRHCTVATHLRVGSDGRAARRPNDDSRISAAFAPAIVVAGSGLSLEISDCILGPLAILGHDVEVHLRNCLIDAGDRTSSALVDATNAAANQGPSRWTLENCTVIGSVRVGVFQLVSNTILLGDTVRAERRQEGCVRFSWLPADAVVPRSHRCVTAVAARPAFTSLRFGDPAYGQLSDACPGVIRSGADDGAEMGVFHELFQPQHEAYLRTRLETSLRLGLEAGVFHAT